VADPLGVGLDDGAACAVGLADGLAGGLAGGLVVGEALASAVGLLDADGAVGVGLGPVLGVGAGEVGRLTRR
jgi:hypothetical protein